MAEALAANLAVTEAGAVMVTVVEALLWEATGPIQPLNTKPAFGVAPIVITLFAAKKSPEGGVTVPAPAGDTAVKSRYWVMKTAL